MEKDGGRHFHSRYLSPVMFYRSLIKFWLGWAWYANSHILTLLSTISLSLLILLSHFYPYPSLYLVLPHSLSHSQLSLSCFIISFSISCFSLSYFYLSCFIPPYFSPSLVLFFPQIFFFTLPDNVLSLFLSHSHFRTHSNVKGRKHTHTHTHAEKHPLTIMSLW